MKTRELTLVAVLLLTGTAFATPADVSKKATLYRPGELLVKFKPGATPDARQAALALARNPRSKVLLSAGLEHWRLPPGLTVAEAMRELRASDAVVYAEPNFIRRPRLMPDDPDFGNQWGLYNDPEQELNHPATDDPTTGKSGADMAMPAAWELQSDASSVVVAVVDDGVYSSHADLRANLIAGRDFVDGDDDPSHGSEGFHGTLVAGAIGAEGNNSNGVSGVAWRVQIMPLRTDFTVANLIEAYQYAADNGAHIVNASFGGPYSQAEYDAIEALHDEGVLFVAAAGNFGWSNDAIPDSPSGYDLDNVLSVAASHPQDGLSVFTQVGPTSVDVAAPGSSIYTTTKDGGYAFVEGTSFSAPYVAGVAALIRARREQETGTAPAFQELKGRIMAGVDLLTPDDDLYGAAAGKLATDGRVDAYNAMTVVPQPVLTVSGFAIDDSAGNGNGALEPGEPFALTVTVENHWAAASGVEGTLSALDNGLNVEGGGTARFAELAGGAESSATFNLQVAADAATHRELPLSLELRADSGYRVTRHFPLELGYLDTAGGTVEHPGRMRRTHWDRVHVYHFDVPEGAGRLSVSASADATATDLDLLLRRSKRPEPQPCYPTGMVPACIDSGSLISASAASDESLIIEAPAAGTYFATVISWPDASKDETATDIPYALEIQIDTDAKLSDGGGSSGGGGATSLGLLGVLLAAAGIRRRTTLRVE